MKYTLLIFFCCISSLYANGQEKVVALTVDGKSVYGTKKIPAEIVGRYQYQKTKSPIVEIKADGTGLFQPHEVPVYPVEYWIETNINGIIEKNNSKVNKNYQMMLIVKYGNNGQAGFRGANAGKFTRIDVTIDFDQGYAVILGERFKKLK